MSLLGVDIGTTGCKTVAFDEQGQMLAENYKECRLHIPEEDHCELDSDEVWSSIVQVESLKGILDCIAYEVRLNLESLSLSGIKVRKLRAVGGGAKSRKWIQLKVDITGIPKYKLLRERVKGLIL